MKPLAAGLAALIGTLAATTPVVAAEPEPLAAVRHGYAIDTPEVLFRQYLFGVAHGVHLLASACLSQPAHADGVQTAYDAWNVQQAATMSRMREALARYHYGKRAAEANWGDVARALGLKETIHPSLGKITLDEACATFAPALKSERYDLARQEAEVPAAAAADRANKTGQKSPIPREKRAASSGPQ